MSSCAKYTIELREIKKVFDFEYDFYEEQYRCDFEDKFLDYYAFNEIGFETIERFKHNLKSHLNLNMPYWQQLYETELAAQGIDFLRNKDYVETFLRTVDTEDNLVGRASSNLNSNTTASSSSDSDSSSTDNRKESNIADGVSSASLSQSLLTGVSEDKSSSSNHSLGASTSQTNTNTSGNNTEDKKGKLLEKTELTGKGNIGVTSSAELLDKWRNVIINIDRIIIDSCWHLFMGVY